MEKDGGVDELIEVKSFFTFKIHFPSKNYPYLYSSCLLSSLFIKYLRIFFLLVTLFELEYLRFCF